jgi:hypothetical protein
VRSAVAALQPAANAIADLGDAQRKFCSFLTKNRLKLVTGAIMALSAVGAISPTAAKGLQVFLGWIGAPGA